jgi:hypothetical protein
MDVHVAAKGSLLDAPTSLLPQLGALLEGITRTAHKARRTPHTRTDRHRQTQTDTDRHRQTQTDTDRHRQTQTDTDRHRQTHFATSSLGAASVRLQKRCRHPRDWLDSLGHVWTGVGRACFLGGDAPLLANRIHVTCMIACTGQHELLPCRCVPGGGHVTMSRWIAAAASPEQYQSGRVCKQLTGGRGRV